MTHWVERLPKIIALQLAIAVAYAPAYRVQAIMPSEPGTETASILFVPAILRVLGTMLSGSLAFIGLFTGSFLVYLQEPHLGPHAWWVAVASAASAPIAYELFMRLGLFDAQPLRTVDTPIVMLFIACYAVTNAGLHMVALALLTGGIASHFPYFAIMVVGDIVPPALGFAVLVAIRHAFRAVRPRRH